MPIELIQDTSIVLSVWTLATLVVAIIKYSSKVSSYKKEIEMRIKEHEAKIKKIEELDLWSRLVKIDTDLEWIKMQLASSKKNNKI